MRVRVKLFATYREMVGAREIPWALHEGDSLGELVTSLVRRYPRLGAHRDLWLLAVNESFATPDVALHDGDVVAIMPPVSGGAV